MKYRNKGKLRAESLLKEPKQALLSENTPFVVVESYKAIRTNIIHMLKGEERKWFSVTSPCPGTGKTTVSLNLGITFAALGKKTVVVDADMRKPMVGKLLSLNKEDGLSEYLSGKTEDINACLTKYPNLYAVSSGAIPPNPSELLSSDRFSAMLYKLSENFDYIIIDTPPVDMVTDAAVISSYVSGTVLVLKQGYTDKERFEDTVKTLKKVDANILGYILNAVDEKKYSYKYGHYSSYYGRYYSKYYGTEEQKKIEKVK